MVEGRFSFPSPRSMNHHLLHLAPPLLATAAMVAPALASEWTSDLPAAMKQAAAENKLVLIEFTGSDWCTYCVQLNRQVLSTPAFAEYIQPRFVPVQIDVPIRKSFDQELLKRNKEICQRYKVPGYPTLMVLTPQGQVVGGFRGDPGNGITGATRHLDAAQKFAHMLEAAEKLEGVEKARMLHAVYSALQPCMRPCTGLRERIAALDPDNVTGIHNELQIELQRNTFRSELAAAREPQAALAVVERHLRDTAPQNRAEIMQAKAAILLATARNEADILAVKTLLMEIAELNPETAARAKNALEERFANPAQVLEHVRQNPPRW